MPYCVVPPIREGEKKASVIEHFFVSVVEQFRTGNVIAVRALFIRLFSGILLSGLFIKPYANEGVNGNFLALRKTSGSF